MLCNNDAAAFLCDAHSIFQFPKAENRNPADHPVQVQHISVEEGEPAIRPIQVKDQPVQTGFTSEIKGFTHILIHYQSTLLKSSFVLELSKRSISLL